MNPVLTHPLAEPTAPGTGDSADLPPPEAYGAPVFEFPLPPGCDWPGHDDLPSEDGAVHDTDELAQSVLLNDGAHDVLQAMHPDGNYTVANDTGIYYELDPVRRVARAVSPDWCYIPGLRPTLDGGRRPSFIVWRESVRPVVCLEYVSKYYRRERDRTPGTGKLWIYENKLKPDYYGVFDGKTAQLDVYQLVGGRLEPMAANAAGRYPIPTFNLELGIWRAEFRNMDLAWIRWFDRSGQLVPVTDERIAAERRRAEGAQLQLAAERRRAEGAQLQLAAERRRAEGAERRAVGEGQRADAEQAAKDRLAAKLRELGIDPDRV